MQRFSPTHSTRCHSLCTAVVFAMLVHLGLILPEFGLQQAHAQGTAQVVFTGIPPVLSSPYIADLERSYQQGLFTTQFIYVSPSRQPQNFRFRLTLEVNGETRIDMTSEANAYTPGIHVYRTFDDPPAIEFPLPYEELIQLLNASVDQSGLLPEGDYVLSIEPLVDDELALIPSVPGMAFFSVRYAEPPLLLTPLDQTALNSQFPVFSWTPVTGAPFTSTFEYELLIVEVFPGQAPYQALESNIPLVQEGLVGQTAFVYTLAELPLEEGKNYAWQVRARDVNEQMPILDQGETEFYTFTVGQDGLGSMITAWSFPVSDPFLIYDFEDSADIDPADTEIFIDGALPIELMGLGSEAQFDKLLIDAETQSIIEGSITFREAIALEVAINPLSDALTGYRAVPSGEALELPDGLLLELGADVFIDRNGLHPRGTQKAIVSYTGLPKTEWTATYSGDFTLNFAPFQISRGRVDFAAGGVAQAYADETGFHLIDQSDPVIAQIPDRLQLPDEQVAFIDLKRAGQSLVDIEPAAGGQFSVTGKPGVPLHLALPGLDRITPDAAHHFTASLEDVVIDAQTGQLVSGQITATPDETAAYITLDALGLPIAPTAFKTRHTDTGVKIDIEGQLTLFGQPLRNAEPIQFTMDEAGVVTGAIDLAEADAYIFLDGEAGNVSMDITDAQGMLRVPLNAFAPAQGGFDVTGTFNLNKGDNVVAAAALNFYYTGEGRVAIDSFAPIENESNSRSISLNGAGLQVDKIEALDLYYTHGQPVRYVADLQASLMPFNGTSRLALPLTGVELHQHKFYIPAQEAHPGTPGFTYFARKAGPATLSLLAYRIPTTLVARKSENGSATVTPYYDFEVNLRDAAGFPDGFADLPLTLQDAQIVDGLVSGNILPYTPAKGSLTLPMEAGVFNAHAISGAFAVTDDAQAFVVSAHGTLDLSGAITGSTQPCAVPDLTLTINAAGEISGNATPFAPCTTFSLGPVAAGFEEAELAITTDETGRRYLLSGEVTSISRRGSRQTAAATGPLVLDLLTGDVQEADVQIERLLWEFPVTAPRYQISVEETHLTAEGFALANDSTVAITDINTADAFFLRPQGDFRLGLHPGKANKGSAALMPRNNPSGVRIATLDADGFHLQTADNLLPERIELPGAFGAYLDLVQAGEDDIALGKSANKGNRTLETADEATVNLVIPQLGTSLAIPVAFAIELTEGLAYAGGTIEHDLANRPVKLFTGDSPLLITGVRYDDESKQLSLTGQLKVPASFTGDEDDPDLEVETTLALFANGLASVDMEAATYALHSGTLSLSPHSAHVMRASGALRLTLNGAIDSPVLNHANVDSAPLGFEATYASTATAWALAAVAPATQKIAIDQATLLLDPSTPPVLSAAPMPVLELTGALVMPATISQDFVSEVAMEIGPGGVYVTQLGEFDAPQSFFNGFLTAYLEAADIFYDAAEQTLVTTIDGAFAPALSLNNNSETHHTFGTPTDLLPFSGIELSTNGAITLRDSSFGRNTTSSTEELRLLADLPRIPVISQHFWIEELILKAVDGELMLGVEGTVRLPTPDGRRVLLGNQTIDETTASLYSDRMPVALTLNSKGQSLTMKGTASQPVLMANNLETDENATQRGFNINGAYLHFNPQFAADNRIHSAASLQVPTGAVSTDSTGEALHAAINFGDGVSTRRHPGIIIAQAKQQQYLVAEQPAANRPAFTLSEELFDTEIQTLALPNPEVPTVTLGGLSRLKVPGLAGVFPVDNITLAPEGIQSLGQSAGPAGITFGQSGLFEVGCVNLGINGRASNEPGFSGAGATTSSTVSRIQFGAVCGDSLSMTLTDKYLHGTYSNLIIRKNGAAPAAQFTSTTINLNQLGAVTGNLTTTRDTTVAALTLEGTTTFRGIRLGTTGTLREIDGKSSLGMLFNPSTSTLDLLDGAATASLAGGGLFLNPTASDLALVDLALNERSNNGFSSNKPAGFSHTGLHAILPVELQLANGEIPVLSGTGLMEAGTQFTTLDLDGALLEQEDALNAGMFLVEQSSTEDTQQLLGLADVSLNYVSLAGGILKANVTAASHESGLSWSVAGRATVDLVDTINLPGQFLIGQDGLLLDLHTAPNLKAGPLSLERDINLSVWSSPSRSTLQGYAAFDAALDLIPGFTVAPVKLYGSFIEDNDESLFYAARNIFADVPFVYSGPIDPWLSLQEGEVYGGDARNTTFRRMITDARQFGNAVPVHATNAINALRNALQVQQTLAFNPVRSGNLPYFAQGAAALKETGEAWATLESDAVAADALPEVLETLREGLYNDTSRPAYAPNQDLPAPDTKTQDALNRMTASVAAAKRSADSDIFALNGLLPRPLLWNSDYVELASALTTLPVTSVTWPGNAENPQAGFSIDAALQAAQQASLQEFKQKNEGLDVQFLRTVGGVELNMVNLKIARSPQQAIDFTKATSAISEYYAQHIDSDWELLNWTQEKATWLATQEDAVDRGIRENLRTFNDKENSEDALRDITRQRHNQVRQLARNTAWAREDLPEDQRFAQYLSGLDADGLKAEFQTTAKDLWYDVPMAALTALSDTLSSLLDARNEQFATGMDTLGKAYGAFSLALDPLYDIQTRFTTTLYGMAEEYRTWRGTIRRLDPEAVNYAFQFVPYRGNYRILADDLIPPVIEDISITPTSEGFLNNTMLTWSATHPVDLVETSLALSYEADAAPQFASVSDAPGFSFFTAKPDRETTERDVNVTLRVRGAGGVPAVKKGQFTVTVDPASDVVMAEADSPLIPSDQTPPPRPRIANLGYSSYFSDTPNTLQFDLAPMADDESGIEQITYRIVNDRNEEEILQDWTELQKSTDYFAGRLVETSLPVQEKELAVRVEVQVRNEAGLTSDASASISLALDDSKPFAAIENISYFNEFDLKHPRAIALSLGEVADEESGIDLIEYALLEGARATLADAIWQPLQSFPNRDTRAGYETYFINLNDDTLPESRTRFALNLRITNGAGLQTIVNEVLDIPGRDVTPPSEPLVSIAHSGFYNTVAQNQLHIIVSGSQDFESGISAVRYRIIDGKTGHEISPWDDFLFLDPNSPTFILPASEKHIALPAFESSRTIIVETQTTNAAGLTSNKGVRFLQLEQDNTAPTSPTLEVASTQQAASGNILLTVGASQDPESYISQVNYRVVDMANQQALQSWRPLLQLVQPFPTFPGLTTSIDASEVPVGIKAGIQVQLINQQGLQTIAASPLDRSEDLTPPLAPSLLLEATAASSEEEIPLKVYLGESRDLESGIASARYRVRDLSTGSNTAWTDIALNGMSFTMPGGTLNTTLPGLAATQAYALEVEIRNAAGLATRVSGIIDRDTETVFLDGAPAQPHVALFHFDEDNTIRQDELELTVFPSIDAHTLLDSLQYKITVFDSQQNEMGSRDRGTWRTVPYRTSKPDIPFTTYLPFRMQDDMATVQVAVRLLNAQGSSPIAQAQRQLKLDSDTSAPAIQPLAYSYSGYHKADSPNALTLNLRDITDADSRIAQVSYRVVNDQNTSDVVVDWTDVSRINKAGIFAPDNVSIVLPEFSRNRKLRIETRALNGAGIASTADTTLDVIVDRTAPVIADPELAFTGITSAHGDPGLVVYLGAITDEESRITSVAYRVYANDDQEATVVDWTSPELVTSNHIRLPAISAPLSAQQLGDTFTLEVEAKNEAGLATTLEREVNANLDNSAPQMPKVEVSYRESDLGTDYLLIEPGAFRDAESKIAALAYRLVDSNNPETVFIDWIQIPVPNDIRVSVAAIAIPRAEIPYDGAAVLAAEFRATNGAGLSSTRRSTVELPGDVSPPDSPSLIVAHRNAYDPLHPNTVEIQIGSSEDTQSAIAQAQYRIIDTATGDELTTWTQLPITSEGYFPGTIVFKELPLIEQSASYKIEVEILNTAGLVNSITEDVRVDIQNDATPPASVISLHYFENALALVLDELADPESKIRKVEYRFLDNVDQSELQPWTDLFEIVTPQGVYPKQSFNINQPAVRSGRTLKIEVRVTNGAGLQTTVSKTVLARSPDSDQ